MQGLCCGDHVFQCREQSISTSNKKSTWPIRSLPAGRNNVAKRMSREWSTFVITGLGKNSPRRFHGGGDTAMWAWARGKDKTNKHGDWEEAAGARQLGSPGGTGGMGADVRKYGTEHPKPGSEPSSHQLNNKQTYEGGPAVVYTWGIIPTAGLQGQQKTRKLGTFLSWQKSKFGNCPSRTDHEPHQ